MHSKKILILSSFGGYGHIAATNTLKALLGNDYEIDTVYPIKDLRILGMPSGEAFYNYTISNNWTALTNWYTSKFSSAIFSRREKKLTALIESYIAISKPDLLISVIPFVNYPVTEAARKFGVPLLIVTTDNDLHNWVFGLEKAKYLNIKVSIGSDLPTTKGLLLSHGVPEGAIETIGLPLRSNFLNTREKTELRHEYGIPLNKKVVLITMGGVGGRSSCQFAQSIMRASLNVHVIVCAGKNRKLVKKLQGIIPSNGNSIAIIPFTEKVHELFALSDLVITKPGPGTINEVLYLKIPILIDHTKEPLFWEKSNIDWVLKLKVGRAIQSIKDIPNLVRLFLYDEEILAEVAKSYDQIPRNQFADQIGLLIREMSSSSSNLLQTCEIT